MLLLFLRDDLNHKSWSFVYSRKLVPLHWLPAHSGRVQNVYQGDSLKKKTKQKKRWQFNNNIINNRLWSLNIICVFVVGLILLYSGLNTYTAELILACLPYADMSRIASTLISAHLSRFLESVELRFNRPFYSCVLSRFAFEWKWG